MEIFTGSASDLQTWGCLPSPEHAGLRELERIPAGEAAPHPGDAAGCLGPTAPASMEQSQEQAGLRRSGAFGGRSSSVGSQPLPRQQGGGTRAGSREAEVRKASSGWALKFEAGRSCWLLWQRRRCILFFFLPQPLGLQPAALTLHGGPASKAWNPSPCPYSVPSFFFLEGGSIFPLGWHFFVFPVLWYNTHGACLHGQRCRSWMWQQGWR